MPAYDYRCVSCDEVFEIVRPLSHGEPVPCPTCGGDTKRVFSPVGVVFKGTGFHNTDYRPRPKEASSDSDAKPAGSCPAAKDSSDSCAGCPAAASE